MDDPLVDVSDLVQDPTAVSADLDGDGVAEFTMGDGDRDGRADWILTRGSDGSSTARLDTDASGSLETGLVDSDGDGRFDTATRHLDDDGEVDVTQRDTDGDGVFDTTVLADETVIRIDPKTGLVTEVSQGSLPADADAPNSRPTTEPSPSPAPAGPATSTPTPSTETAAPRSPATPAPLSEAVVAPAISPSDPAPPPTPVAAPTTSSTTEPPGPALTIPATSDPGPQTPWPDDQPGIGDGVADTETVAEPETAPDRVPVIDLVHGDAASERRWGQVQTQDGYCGPVSIAMVLSELTGVIHNETQMVQAAIDRGTLQGEPGAWDGMYVQDVATMLTEFGAPAHVEYGTLDTLRAYLDQGRDIILFVDSDEVWHGIDDDGTADDRQDHFLVITEIDDERGVATLNDPGLPNGIGREVLLSVIEDAWQDSSYEMVVTDAGVLYGRAAEAPDGRMEAAKAHHPGFVILPILLRAAELVPFVPGHGSPRTTESQ